MPIRCHPQARAFRRACTRNVSCCLNDVPNAATRALKTMIDGVLTPMTWATRPDEEDHAHLREQPLARWAAAAPMSPVRTQSAVSWQVSSARKRSALELANSDKR